MNLDDRLRDELRQVVDPATLRVDEAFEQVRVRHGRGLMRTRVTRQAAAVAVALSLFASVVVVVSWRNAPDRYRSTATVGVAAESSSRVFKLSDPRKLALAPGTRRAALVSAQLSPDDTRIDFRATFNSERDLLTLAAVAPSARESRTVTREWVSVFTRARRVEAIRGRREADHALRRRVIALHNRLRQVDASLKRIDPVFYRNLRYYPPYGYPFSDEPIPSPPSSPSASASVRELNLFNERVQILTMLADLGEAAAKHGPLPLGGPAVVAKPIAPAVRIDTTSPATVPLVVGWMLSFVVVLAAALLVYRRRTHAARQVSA